MVGWFLRGFFIDFVFGVFVCKMIIGDDIFLRAVGLVGLIIRIRLMNLCKFCFIENGFRSYIFRYVFVVFECVKVECLRSFRVY